MHRHMSRSVTMCIHVSWCLLSKASGRLRKMLTGHTYDLKDDVDDGGHSIFAVAVVL